MTARRILAGFALVLGLSGASAEGLVFPLAVTGGRQWLSSGFGDRSSPMGGGGSGFHAGIDLAARKGTPVLAAGDGYAVSVYPAPNGYWKGDTTFGGLVVLRLDCGLYVLYGHLSRVDVSERVGANRVRAGQVLGLVGSTGISTGPHLHFEILIDPVAAFDRTPRAWAMSH
jgi:murein DD-endopeptidase MepM/ murein hydrolase activator NlpD